MLVLIGLVRTKGGDDARIVRKFSFQTLLEHLLYGQFEGAKREAPLQGVLGSVNNLTFINSNRSPGSFPGHDLQIVGHYSAQDEQN